MCAVDWMYAILVKCLYLTVICKSFVYSSRRWRNWLRHCATSWKVLGSIPNSVIGIFPSNCTIALGLTHPLIEMSYKEYCLWDESSQCVGLTTLPLLCANCFEIWDPQPPGTLKGMSGPVQGYVSHHIQSDLVNQ